MTTIEIDDDDLIGAPTCKKCKKPHLTSNGTPSCSAHKAANIRMQSDPEYNPCRAHPVPGGTVCVRHGGKTQQRGQLVQNELARREMAHATEMLGLTNYDITPEEALLQTVRESAANVAFFRARVQSIVGDADLDDPNHPLIWGTTQIVDTGSGQWPGQDETTAAGVNQWYSMYLQEREHLLKASQAALRAGIAERRVRMAEMGANVIVGRIRQILNALNLSPDQIREADRVVPLQISMLAQDLEASQV